MWFLSRDDASGGRVPIAQDGEIVRITPEAPASNISTTASTPVVSTTPEFHIVQPGEVLSTIASKYNTTVEVLAEINEIEDVDAIRVGQRIRLVPAEQ